MATIAANDRVGEDRGNLGLWCCDLLCADAEGIFCCRRPIAESVLATATIAWTVVASTTARTMLHARMVESR